MGALCLVFGIALVAIDTTEGWFSGGSFAHGIWCGIYVG